MAVLYKILVCNVADPANNQEYITYNRDFISNKPYATPADETAGGPINFVTGKPTYWLSVVVYYVASGETTPVISNNGGLTQIDFGTAVFADGPVRKGDRYYKTNPATAAYEPPNGYAIIDSNQGGTTSSPGTDGPSLIILLDCPFADFVERAHWEIYLTNPIVYLKPPFLTQYDPATGLYNQNPYYPNIFAQFSNLNRVAFIFISAEDYVKSYAQFQTPTNNAGWLLRQIKLSYGLASESTYTQSSGINVTNAQLITPVNFQSGFSNKYKNAVLNMLKTDADGVVRPYYIKWIKPDCSFFFGNRFIQQLRQDSTSPATVEASSTPLDLGTMVEMPVGPSEFWVAYLSRYGGIECLCFNYLQEQTESTKSKGPYRNMYTIRDLGKIASTSIEISSPFMLNTYREWYIDLQNSAKVWFSRKAIRTGADGSIMDFDAMDWTEGTIADTKEVVDNALSKMVQFVFTINTAELNPAYNG